MIFVYKIRNTATKAEYVGKTNNTRTRIYHHFFELKKGTHFSKSMQSDFHKHGELSFEYNVIKKFKLKQEASEFEFDLIYKRQPIYNAQGKKKYIEPLEKTTKVGRPRRVPTKVISFRVNINIGNAQVEMIKKYIASIDCRR